MRLREEGGSAQWGRAAPAWTSGEPVVLSGRVLAEAGLQLPTLWPAEAIVLHLTAV